MRITNKQDISLLLAVWLVDDNYDYAAGKGLDKPYISVTTLMRPLKQIILAMRIPLQDREEDVEDYIARSLGNTIHDGIEKAWVNNAERNLLRLGYPKGLVQKVKINPTDEEREADPEMIPVYLEQRGYREFGGYIIGGKFDAICDGRIEDNKSTSAYGWVFGTRDEENQLQGSLYNWIDDARPLPWVTEGYMRVNYIFTDWQKAQARSNPDYPQRRVLHKDIELLSITDTEMFVKAKLHAITKNMQLPEDKLPRCTDEDLWRSEPQYRYFADPVKARTPGAKSTKNFTDLSEANQHTAGQGKGVVITKPGEVKRCPYCPAYDICEQRREYFND